MNIDDLWKDIHEIENEMSSELLANNGPNATFYYDMVAVANMYEEDRTKCKEMIEDFQIKHKYKINII